MWLAPTIIPDKLSRTTNDSHTTQVNLSGTIILQAPQEQPVTHHQPHYSHARPHTKRKRKNSHARHAKERSRCANERSWKPLLSAMNKDTVFTMWALNFMFSMWALKLMQVAAVIQGMSAGCASVRSRMYVRAAVCNSSTLHVAIGWRHRRYYLDGRQRPRMLPVRVSH